MSFRDKTSKLLDHAYSSSFFGEKEKAKYLPKKGGTYYVTAIFDQSWNEVDLDGEVLVSSSRPYVGIKKSNLGPIKPAKNDQIELFAKLYRVNEIQEDGQGDFTLYLFEVD